MKFGFEKCARISLKNGTLYTKQQIGNTMENEIKELELMKVYKYLGVTENHNIEHKNEKVKLKKEYVRRPRLILSTELSEKNKMQAIGSLVVPVLRYSFGIIDWNQEEIQKLDRETRKMLTIYGQHHPRADTDGLYVPRKEGGRVLMQVEGAYVAETLNLVEYVENKDDPLIQTVRTYQHNTNSALLQTANNSKKSFQSETKQIKNTITQNLKEKWEEKRMHRQFPRSLDEKLVDKEQSYRWLKFGDIKGVVVRTTVGVITII
jgi:hypothetical protein